ncbi:MAG: class II fructose-bisphosphate aldolase [Nitrospinota bacterium]
MKATTIAEIKELVGNSVSISDTTVTVNDENHFIEKSLDNLIYNGVFADSYEVRGFSRWLIKAVGLKLGVFSASIQGLYEEIGSGSISGYTVPAINIRGLTYDFAATIFRSAKKINAGGFIFEIAKSEIEYTFQRPSEFTTIIIAAAIKERYRGPVFVQGDHFQVNLKKYKADKESEIQAIKDLIREAIAGGFYNIDIDTSTLVDLSEPTLDAQQKLNYEEAAKLTSFLRSIEPDGISISIGGEIGEVGEQNSTVEELDAYMQGYNKTLATLGDHTGISKVSVQTGTSHGGVPLPDGSIAEVALDFETLNKLGHLAKTKYGISGAVQHGASTLPDELFHKFPTMNTSEIHLATGFQNIIYDSSNFPSDIRDQIYAKLKTKFAAEKKEGQTDEQFIYKTRKKGFGLAKELLWTLPYSMRAKIQGELEEKLDFIFKQLNIANSYDDVIKAVTDKPIEPNLEEEINSAKGFTPPEHL